MGVVLFGGGCPTCVYIRIWTFVGVGHSNYTECDDTHGQLMHVVRESEDGDERRVVVGAENGLRR